MDTSEVGLKSIRIDERTTERTNSTLIRDSSLLLVVAVVRLFVCLFVPRVYCARTHARSSQRTTRVFLITFKSNLSQSDEERERERERENELDVNQRLVTITITSNRNCLFVCAARVHVRTIESNKRARRGSFSFFSLSVFSRVKTAP